MGRWIAANVAALVVSIGGAAVAAEPPFVVLHQGGVYANTYIEDGHFDDADRKFLVPLNDTPVATTGSFYQVETRGPFSASAQIASNTAGTFVQTLSFGGEETTRSSSLPGQPTAYVDDVITDFLAEITVRDAAGGTSSFIRLSALKLSAHADVEGYGLIGGTHSVYIDGLSLTGDFFGGNSYAFSGFAAPNTTLFASNGLSLVLNWTLPPQPPSFTQGIGEAYPVQLTFDFLALGDDIISGRVDGGFAAVAYFAAVPESSTWALMILGFAGTGAALRRERRAARVRSYS
jgi:hypothetical protein